MAGGKETPRQKMIGMMYLVLTALLALQVSSAIMEKFKLLDDSLQNANQVTNTNNGHAQAKIAKAVDQAGNKDADKAVLKKANDVRAVTSEIRKYLHEVREKMVAVSGGREPDGNYKGAKEETAIEVYMVGTEGTKNGEGYKMQKKVNDYALKVAEITGNKSLGKPLCLDGKDNPMFAKNPDQRAKDFANVSFAQTPMIAALAVVSTIESDVLKLESQALEELALLVGAADLKFDVV
jgi:gliding motility-associated protein GldM